MHEESAPSGKYLSAISADFVRVADRLKEASYIIRKQGGYSYPVFLVSSVPLSVGALLIEKQETDNQWYYYAAYLNILMQYGLVAKDRAAAFQKVYKDPDEFCCLLVVDTIFTNFVHIPYPEE